MKALVTGVTGFVGPYLVNHLVRNGFDVFGIDRSGKEVPGCAVEVCDVTNAPAVSSIVRKVKPEFIFHLAGQSSVERSWKEPELTRNVHINGTRNLLDAVLASKIKPRILVVSSAEVYGVPKSIPISESHPALPITPYGESRIGQERVALEYFNKGVDLVISRSFNQTGPGQPSAFVCSDFARQVAEIEKGMRNSIVVGNLSVKRDFTDVRDAVAAYLLALRKCKPGEIYNISSGKGYSIRWIVDKLISLSKVKDARISQDSSKVRKADIPELVGDNSKFRKATGWKPSFDFADTLSDLLDYWRKEI